MKKTDVQTDRPQLKSCKKKENIFATSATAKLSVEIFDNRKNIRKFVVVKIIWDDKWKKSFFKDSKKKKNILCKFDNKVYNNLILTCDTQNNIYIL